ncbi:hypothetical protein DPMN_094356 [Dreissena polymorpha]|uniref:Uncharacterized protein n=1 Tax=Dreissena polymorpha TaxID=45954 RepID=A0A9D4L5Z1_DREPO|nr:hypothetical protein DPMN_094356 [Dreissena polymorpha]
MDEPKRVVSKAASTQTEQEATQEPSLVATALFQLEKTIESSIGKLISAVEFNSRAIKNLEVTVQKVGDQRRQKDHELDEMGAKRLKKLTVGSFVLVLLLNVHIVSLVIGYALLIVQTLSVQIAPLIRVYVSLNF